MPLKGGSRRFTLTELAVYLAMIVTTLAVMLGFLFSLDSRPQFDGTSIISDLESPPFTDVFVLGTLAAASTLGALVGGGFSVVTNGRLRVKLAVVLGAIMGLIGGWIVVYFRV